MLNLIPPQYRALAGLFFCASLVLLGAIPAYHYTAKYKDAVYTSQISAMKQEASRQLIAAQKAVSDAAIANQQANDKLEKKDHEAQHAIDKALADNRALARKLGGLRDPGSRPSCDGTMPSTTDATGSNPATATGSELSAEASEFLLEFAADADRAAAYAKTCHDWAVSGAPEN